MEEENIENLDSTNENEDNTESSEEETNEDSETVDSLKEKNQRLYEQLKKAKGFTRDEEGQWIKKPEVRIETKETKSDGIGYAEKAFLLANGIKGEETKLVEEAIKKTGGTIEEVLANQYFQAQLKEVRDLAITSDATPKGNRAKGIPTDSVEYWMAKPIEDVPQNMRLQVVNAKLEQDKVKGTFYNSA